MIETIILIICSLCISIYINIVIFTYIDNTIKFNNGRTLTQCFLLPIRMITYFINECLSYILLIFNYKYKNSKLYIAIEKWRTL